MTDLSLSKVTSIEVSHSTAGLDIEIDGAQDSEILDIFTADDIVAHYDIKDLIEAMGPSAALEHIDKEDAVSYYGIEEV